MSRILTYSSSRHLIACPYRAVRFYSSPPTSFPPFTTPKPPSLPPKEQKEWEESMRRQESPEVDSSPEEDLEIHPDARKRVKADFEGDVNPVTGEVGGPKKEPLGWGANGEWTYGGRATDF